MNKFNHLVVFDLGSYGAAMAIINRFVDDAEIKVFEISPCGNSAILILLATDATALSVVYNEAISLFKQQILSARLLENIHSELLPAYLSQNKPQLSDNLIILEGSSVSTGLFLANKLLGKKQNLVDFRVIRTSPKSIIITLTNQSINELEGFDFLDFKKSFIENIQPVVKNYYELS